MSTVINAGLVTRWWPRRLRHPGLVELAVCQRLRALAAQVPADEAIVELGAYQGRATGWLLLGASEGQGAHVTTVDPWTLYKPRQDTPEELSVLYGRAETYAVFKQHMDAIGATPDRLTVKRGYAHTIGRKWVGGPVGLLWHDAEHSADAVARDLEAWLPHLSEGAVVVLHDAGNPEYGVVEGALRVLGDGWQFEDEDGRLHDEPQVIRWRKNPQRRGMLVARRCLVEETSPQEEAVEEPSGVVGDVEDGGLPRVEESA